MDSFLLAIEPTLEGLRDSSIYIMETCVTKCDELVAAWINAFNASKTSASKQLTLFYVVNEVFQRSQRQYGTIYIDAFLPVLPSYLHRLIKAHPELAVKVARVFDIWDERRTLGGTQIKELRKALGMKSGGGDGRASNKRTKINPSGDETSGGGSRSHSKTSEGGANENNNRGGSPEIDELLDDDDILGGAGGSGSIALRRASSNSNLHQYSSPAQGSPRTEGSPYALSGSNEANSPSGARSSSSDPSSSTTTTTNASGLSPLEALLHAAPSSETETSFEKLARLGSASILPLPSEMTAIFEELNESDRAGAYGLCIVGREIDESERTDECKQG